MNRVRRSLRVVLAALVVFALASCARATPAPQSGSEASRTALSADDSAPAAAAAADRSAAAEPSSKDKGENDLPPAITPTRTPAGHVGIKRSELDRLLKRGANNFIGLIDVRPAFRRGRFLGWRVIGYRGPGQLRRGDVVLRVNGQSVERPGQFIGVWQRLATAKVLVIEILRRGKRKRWAFAILDG